MKKDKNIDELFREKLGNYEKLPPAFLLENILAASAGAQRKRKLVFWRVAAVAAALLLAFVAGWQINELNSERALPAFAKSQEIAPEALAESAGLIASTKILPDAEVTSGTIDRSANAKSAIAKNQISVRNENTLMVSKVVAKPSGMEKMKPMSLPEHWVKRESADSKVLHRMKYQDKNELAILSIDQQIMANNRQMFLKEKSADERKHWIVGAQVSPVYNVSRSNHSQIYASNMMNSSSSNPVDLGGGVSVEMKTGKRWSLQSGVYYSAMEQSSGNSSYSSAKGNVVADAIHGSEYLNTNVRFDASNNQMMMNATAGVIEFSGIPSGIEIGASLEDKSLSSAVVVSDARFVQNFEYIEIPLYLRYTVLDKRINIEMMGGFSSNLLVGNQTFMDNGNGNNLIGKTRDMQAVNYSGALGVGFKYGLSKQIYLNIEPRVKYYLNSLNNNASVSYKPYTIGIFTGLSYQF
jgi:hypothetical protein